MERLDRQIQAAKKVLNTPNADWSDCVSVIEEVAISVERLGPGDSTKEAVRLLMSISRELGEQITAIRSKLVKDVCEHLVRIVKVTEQDFQDAANALLPQVIQTAKSASSAIRQPGAKLLRKMSELVRYDLSLLRKIFAQNSQEKVRVLVLEQLMIIIVFWSEDEVKVWDSDVVSMLRLGLDDQNDKVRKVAREAVTGFTTCWNERALEFVDMMNNQSRMLLVREHPDSPLAAVLQQKYPDLANRAKLLLSRSRHSFARQRSNYQKSPRRSTEQSIEIHVATPPQSQRGQQEDKLRKSNSSGSDGLSDDRIQESRNNGGIVSRRLFDDSNVSDSSDEDQHAGVLEKFDGSQMYGHPPRPIPSPKPETVAIADVVEPPSPPPESPRRRSLPRSRSASNAEEAALRHRSIGRLQETKIPSPSTRSPVLQGKHFEAEAGDTERNSPTVTARHPSLLLRPGSFSAKSRGAAPSTLTDGDGGQNVDAASSRVSDEYFNKPIPSTMATPTPPPPSSDNVTLRPRRRTYVPHEQGDLLTHSRPPAENGSQIERLSPAVKAALEFTRPAHNDSLFDDSFEEENEAESPRDASENFGEQRFSGEESERARGAPLGDSFGVPRHPSEESERAREAPLGDTFDDQSPSDEESEHAWDAQRLSNSEVQSGDISDPELPLDDSLTHDEGGALEEWNLGEEAVSNVDQIGEQALELLNDSAHSDQLADSLTEMMEETMREEDSLQHDGHAVSDETPGLWNLKQEEEDRDSGLADLDSDDDARTDALEGLRNVRDQMARLRELTRNEENSNALLKDEIRMEPQLQSSVDLNTPVWDQDQQMGPSYLERLTLADRTERSPLEHLVGADNVTRDENEFVDDQHEPSPLHKFDRETTPKDIPRQDIYKQEPFDFMEHLSPEPVGEVATEYVPPKVVTDHPPESSCPRDEAARFEDAEKLIAAKQFPEPPTHRYYERPRSPEPESFMLAEPRHDRIPPTQLGPKLSPTRTNTAMTSAIPDAVEQVDEQTVNEETGRMEVPDSPALARPAIEKSESIEDFVEDPPESPSVPAEPVASKPAARSTRHKPTKLRRIGSFSMTIVVLCAVLFCAAGVLRAVRKVRDSNEYHLALKARIGKFEAAIAESHEKVNRLQEDYAIWSERVRQLAEEDEANALAQFETIQMEVHKWQQGMKAELLAFRQALSKDSLEHALAALRMNKTKRIEN